MGSDLSKFKGNETDEKKLLLSKLEIPINNTPNKATRNKSFLTVITLIISENQKSSILNL